MQLLSRYVNAIDLEIKETKKRTLYRMRGRCLCNIYKQKKKKETWKRKKKVKQYKLGIYPIRTVI